MRLLTIVTVNKNSGDLFEITEKNVKALLNSMDSLFWLIIDSNSTDSSYERIKDIINDSYNFPIKVIREKDDGIYNAMNKGIVNANSKFLIFLNSGDTINSHILRKLCLKRLIRII